MTAAVIVFSSNSRMISLSLSQLSCSISAYRHAAVDDEARVPVMYEAASEHSQTIARAISSGSETRPMGTLAAIADMST